MDAIKITDLTFDCLVHCFKDLSIEDLLNVADSNKGLKPAAGYIFQQNDGHKLVRFDQVLKSPGADGPFGEQYMSFCCRYYSNRLHLTDRVVNIHHLQFGLQFLRCFGELISQMEFHFCSEEDRFSTLWSCECCRDKIVANDKFYEREHQLIEYLDKYCTKTLRKVKFEGNLLNFRNSPLIKLTKPFDNVEKLESNIFFPAQKKLHVLFPYLRELEFTNIRTPMSSLHKGGILLQNDFMANRFPYLEHLNIDLGDRYRFNRENFAIALRSSPRLKTIKGGIWFDVLFKENISANLWYPNKHFQHLKRLDLVVNLNLKLMLLQILSRPVREDIHFSNLKELNISFSDQSIDDTVTEWTFPFICEKLESLTLRASKGKLKQFSGLLKKHPTVKKLKLNYSGITSRDDCLLISTAFPLLEEIFFEKMPYNLPEAIDMFQSLKRFKSHYLRPYENIGITVRIADLLYNWSITNTILEPQCDIFIEGRRIF